MYMYMYIYVYLHTQLYGSVRLIASTSVRTGHMFGIEELLNPFWNKLNN